MEEHPDIETRDITDTDTDSLEESKTEMEKEENKDDREDIEEIQETEAWMWEKHYIETGNQADNDRRHAY